MPLDDDFDPKQLILDTYAAAEVRLMARLKTESVAFYAGQPNYSVSPHLAKLPALINSIDADILVYADRRRTRDQVESIAQRLPEFIELPLTVSNVSCQRLLNPDLFPAHVRCMQMDFTEQGNQRVFLPLRWTERWALWIELDVDYDTGTRHLAIIAFGGVTDYLALVCLMRQGVTPATIVQLPDAA